MPPPTSTHEMFSRVRDLAEAVRPRSAEFETANDLPADVFAAIAETGVTRTCVPRAIGGLEGTPIDAFLATSLLAEADPAVAWIVGQGIVQNAWVSTGAAAAFATRVMADPAALPATSINGKATLKPLGDGTFEFEGQFRFLSGCSGATLIGGLAMVVGERVPPEFRFAVASASEATISRTWDSFGFCGTGSHEARVGPLRIDAGQTWVVGEAPAHYPHPLTSYREGTWPIAASAAAVQIGIARRALNEARAHVQTKSQKAFSGGQGPLAQNSAVLRQLARAEGAWDASRAGVLAAIGELWQAAQAGPLPETVTNHCRLACATAVWSCADVVTTAYNLGGTAAQANSHALQRCFRDGHILTAHISVSDEVFEALGRASFAE